MTMPLAMARRARFHIAARIVRAVSGHIDGAARRLKGRSLQLRARKFDAAAD
jgi:hypothetical protein